MNRYQRLFRPAWVLKLTNKELIEAFGAADDCREARGDAPDLLRRMDVLHNEISRRERGGTLVDDDWKVKA
jgi:hypothetical protein